MNRVYEVRIANTSEKMNGAAIHSLLEKLPANAIVTITWDEEK